MTSTPSRIAEDVNVRGPVSQSAVSDVEEGSKILNSA